MFLAKGKRFRALSVPACLLVLAVSAGVSAQSAPKKVEKPCEGGVVHTAHAYSKCIDGFWHVVSDVEYVCPDGSRELVTKTEKTDQKCAEKFDLLRHLQGPCQAPQPAGEHVVRKCVQGFWEEDTYSQFRCLDGSLRIIGPPIRSVRTTERCEEKAAKETSPKGRSIPENSKTGSAPEVKTSPPPPPPTKSSPPPPPPSKMPPTPPASNTSTYICGKAVCDCAKQSPPKICKAGSGCACTKG